MNCSFLNTYKNNAIMILIIKVLLQMFNMQLKLNLKKSSFVKILIFSS